MAHPQSLKEQLGSSQNPDLTLPGMAYGPDRPRASWTYDPNPACYGTMGVEGGIAKAVTQMDRLYALALSRNIPLSVGVYPWPQQLLYDGESHVRSDFGGIGARTNAGASSTIFRRCRVQARNKSFLRGLFIWGDIHYNNLGNALIARDLVAQYP